MNDGIVAFIAFILALVGIVWLLTVIWREEAD